MQIIFPSHPAKPHKVESSFEEEEKCARENGFDVGLLDMGIHLGDEVRIRSKIASKAIYRGWLMKPNEYSAFEENAAAKGIELVTNEDDYKHAYELPEWIKVMEVGSTPFSAITDSLDPEAAALFASRSFGPEPAILKDFVKTRKHEWFDACYIADCSDETEVKRIVSNFIRLMGDELYGGLVFRKYVNFKSIGIHPKSRMPLVKEYRYFLYDHKAFFCAPYWNVEQYPSGDAPPTFKEVEAMVSGVKSNFFVADVAETEGGKLMVMEINDAGAAGLPESASPMEFYKKLAEAVNR